MNPIAASQKHLNKSQMGYFAHLYHAFRLGLVLIYAGIASILHAFLPFLFPAYSANKVTWMYIRVVLDSANPDIQGYRSQELALRDARVSQQKRYSR
jgi:hypothetical protein